MNSSNITRRQFASLTVLVGFGSRVSGQVMAKAQVANLIVKVENGVDQFRDYLKRRGDNARNTASTPAAQSRKSRRAAAGAPTASKENVEARKDDLDDALGDLNRSTNRLRRKFDATDKWMETRVEVERMMDDGRRINQVVVRGNYGAEAARLWGVLRTGMNDLARAYGLTPMAL